MLCSYWRRLYLVVHASCPWGRFKSPAYFYFFASECLHGATADHNIDSVNHNTASGDSADSKRCLLVFFVTTILPGRLFAKLIQKPSSRPSKQRAVAVGTAANGALRQHASTRHHLRKFLLHNACGEDARLVCSLLVRWSLHHEKKSMLSFAARACPQVGTAVVEPQNTVSCFHDASAHRDTVMMGRRSCTTSSRVCQSISGGICPT